MRNEVFPLPEVKIQVVGIDRIAEKLGMFLLLLTSLIIIVAWLGFAARAEKTALEVEAQTLKAQTLRLRDANIALLERVYKARLLAEAPGFFHSRNWEVLARGP